MPHKAITENTLFYDDNLDVLREYIGDETVDLIYLDPPFNSNHSYNVLFRDEIEKGTGAHMAAPGGSWHWGKATEGTYFELIQSAPVNVSKMINALREGIGANQMMAFLVMMTARLLELHRVLKPTGSLYLHCDSTTSHYLKIILDAIFSPKYFRNEIIWQRRNVHRHRKAWSTVSDTILLYTKSDRFTWNPLYLPQSEQHLKSKYRNVNVDGEGRRYTLSDTASPSPRPDTVYEWNGYQSPPNGWRYSQETMAQLDREGRIWYPPDRSKRPRLKRYLDERPGRLEDNIWTDINLRISPASERVRYPAQKPLALLDRIIEASSNVNDIILDPFCGCGTAIIAAHKLNRRWIGIDVTHLSISLMKYRLRDNFGLKESQDFQVIGEPESVSGARQLAKDNCYQFQWWALSLVQAKALGGEGGKQGKKGADQGIDGVLNFVDDKNKLESVLVQVKSGHVKAGDIRDLRGVLEREEAAIGLFITLENPSREILTEAVSAGYYHSTLWNKEYARLQILSIEDLLGGKGIDMPPSAYGTFKQARKVKKDDISQPGLL